MDDITISLIVSSVALLISMITFFLWNRSRSKKPEENSFSTRPLQLQAYERLVLLAERLSIPNLVSRASQQDLGLRDMQLLLLESIKQEFEYNVSQQIYVSPVAWEAVRNLKEQNMLIINQVAASIPPDAKGIELNRRLLDFTMNQQKGALHTIVVEAINYEARKLMR